MIGKNDLFVSEVSGHYCRIGTAIDLQGYGATGIQLQDAGGWISPVMPDRYTRKDKYASGAMAKMRKQHKETFEIKLII